MKMKIFGCEHQVRCALLMLPILIVAGGLVCQAQSQATEPQTQALTSTASAVSEPTLTSSAGTVSDSAASRPDFSERYPRYELRAGDVFEVNFEFSPELNQTVTVQPDGYVTLRGAGDVHVAGQTVPAVAGTIKIAYSKTLKDPSVSIVLKDFEKPYFTASGQVGKPGKYEMRGDVTVTEALAIAGGLTESSKHSQVILYRRVSSDWMEGKVLDVKKMMAQRKLNEDLHLKPGDMLFVPQNAYSKYKRFIPTAGMGSSFPIP